MTIAPVERYQAPAAAPQHGAGALSLSHMTPQEAWLFCESLAATPLLPDQYRKQPASVLWAMEYGRALGLDVVTTITTIHVIKGKPTQSADLMLGRARSAGHRVRIQSERTRCEARITRHDDPDYENVIEWTLDDAVTAGLCTIRDNRPYSRDDKNRPQSWEKYPRAMLRARAIAECVRAACPEVLHGAIYTPEELGAVVNQEGQPVHVAERAEAPVMQAATVVSSTVGQPTAPPRNFIAEAMATTDETELAAILDAAREAGAPDVFLAEFADIQAAQLAADVVAVRALYDTAKANGAAGDHLERLATIGATKPGAKQRPNTPLTDGELRAALGSEHPEVAESAEQHMATEGQTAEQEAEQAEQRLRLAASKANLLTVDADFERAYGMPINKAPAAPLLAMADMIEKADQR